MPSVEDAVLSNILLWKKNIETNDFFDIDLQTETWEHLKEFYENNIEKIRMKQQE